MINKIYDILVKDVGASNNNDDRQIFCNYIETHLCDAEFRFMGLLGFGGKFYINRDQLYIACYSEDESPQRKAIIKRVNNKLKTLKKEFDQWTAKKSPSTQNHLGKSAKVMLPTKAEQANIKTKELNAIALVKHKRKKQ